MLNSIEVVSDTTGLNAIARELIGEAKSNADYDEPLFEDANTRDKLLELGRKLLAAPEASPLRRSDAYSLYEALDSLLTKGLWHEESFSEITTKMLLSESPKVRGVFIDCLFNKLPYLDQIIKNNPDLLDNLLTAAESGISAESLVQVGRIFKAAAKLDEVQLSRLFALVEKRPESGVLSAFAEEFSDTPYAKLTEILQTNFGEISANATLAREYWPISRYLLKHAPSVEVYKLADKVMGREYLASYGEHGAVGLLEAAINLKNNNFGFGIRLFGLKNLWNLVTNRGLSSRNFTEDAAIRSIIDNLKGAQFEEPLKIAFKALGQSKNPLAVKYLEDIRRPQGRFQKAIDFITDDWSNVTENDYRSVWAPRPNSNI